MAGCALMGARPNHRARGVPIPTASTATAGPVRLEVNGLSKHFGPVRAVSELSFTVEPGSVTGFLGPNGAGKTTTLRMVLGLEQPDAGTATFNGIPYTALTDPVRTVGAVLETAFHPARSGRNHLRVYCRAAGLPVSRADEVLVQVGLADAGDRRTGGYSLGMRPRLGAAGGGRPPPRRLLPRHASAAGAGDRAARRPRRPRPGRAGERPGPRGHP